MRASLKVDSSGKGSATPSKQRRRSTINKGSSNGAGEGGGGGREDSSMEALEAQRYLQTTLPRFLENIDDAYKVPFNFKVRRLPQFLWVAVVVVFAVEWWW